jgi:amino acid permease (GABA permease)
MGDAGSGMRSSSGGAKSDTERLHELGYAQELKRGMGAFSNFAVSFTIISILSGCLTLYGFGMDAGGPIVMTIGWPLVGLMTTFVALAMAEVCSSYPTAGGLYYWSAKMAKRNGAAWSWFTGWFNLIGQVGVTAGIDFGLAFFINAFLNIGWNVSTAPEVTILIYGIVLALHALLNTFGVRLVAILNDVSVWWHILGVLIIVVTLFVATDDPMPLGEVFTRFENSTGFSNSFYVFLVGLLLAQYTFTGYDASAHMTEETTSADVSGPRGIVMSVLVSLVAGWILLIGVTYGIGAGAGAYDAVNGSATGVPPAQVFINAVGKGGGLVLLFIVIGAQFFCGMSSVTANSRMIYAFARDGALPGSKYWHKINKRTRTPTDSIWLAAIGAFVLGLPYLYSPVAYFAVTSIAVIGLYIAYVIPVFLRLRNPEGFHPGPWTLGAKGKVIGWIAVLWVVFIAILFMLPQYAPITIDTFNYAPVAVGTVLLLSGLWYALSARKWFKGPKVQGSAEELAAIEADLESV